MKYDLIIIGSGSVGAAAGYYATRAGLNVLMIDAHMPPHQQGSHHGDTRLIRHAYGEGEKYVPLVLRAQQLWDELSTHNEEPVFVRSGVMIRFRNRLEGFDIFYKYLMQRFTFCKCIIFIIFLGVIFIHFVNGITQRYSSINIIQRHAINGFQCRR